MFHDLNIPWTSNLADVQRKISFLAELGYNVLALSHSVSGKLPAKIESPIPDPLPFAVPKSIRLLSRLTVQLDDPSQNHRLPSLRTNYDLLAVRPTDEKTLQQACASLDCDIISLDLSHRFFFRFKHKMLAVAVARGVKIELCYAAALSNNDSASRRNVLQNAVGLVRATRGRGIIVSSEAKDALGLRGPWDVINLCIVWGLGPERGHEAVCKEARHCVAAAGLRKGSFRGAVVLVSGGEGAGKIEAEAGKGDTGDGKCDTANINKRKAEAPVPDTVEGQPLSKRAQKRLAKQERAEQAKKLAGLDAMEQ